jgi:predicted phosphodiesterase
MTNGVSFIHLSDIHFNKDSGDQFDVDLDLRNEIVRDISKNAHSTLENLTGVLVCGDVAFSGAEQEYIRAQEFLREICEGINISETAVFCVPGNHDVDHTMTRSSLALNSLQRDIDSVNESVAIDAKLSSYLRDTLCKDIIFGHIDTYNTKFAGHYECNINSQKPVWEQYITLDQDLKLCIHGMNSTIISNHEDTEDRLMIIGQHQIPQRKEGIVYLTLCHHPPECWKDIDNTLKNKMNNRVSIQLYGHKHIQEISVVDNSLIIGSGATHPSRWQGDWIPRYNWLSINLDTSGSDRVLIVKIYPRILDKYSDQFVVDSSVCVSENYIQYTLKLNDEKKNITLSSENVDMIREKYSDITVNYNDEILTIEEKLDTKKLVYRFMNLSYLTRTTILTKFNLLDEEDEGVNHVDIIQKVLQKAKMHNCLNELWNEISYYSS